MKRMRERERFMWFTSYGLGVEVMVWPSSPFFPIVVVVVTVGLVLDATALGGVVPLHAE